MLVSVGALLFVVVAEIASLTAFKNVCCIHSINLCLNKLFAVLLSKIEHWFVLCRVQIIFIVRVSQHLIFKQKTSYNHVFFLCYYCLIVLFLIMTSHFAYLYSFRAKFIFASTGIFFVFPVRTLRLICAYAEDYRRLHEVDSTPKTAAM